MKIKRAFCNLCDFNHPASPPRGPKKAKKLRRNSPKPLKPINGSQNIESDEKHYRLHLLRIPLIDLFAHLFDDFGMLIGDIIFLMRVFGDVIKPDGSLVPIMETFPV